MIQAHRVIHNTCTINLLSLPCASAVAVSVCVYIYIAQPSLMLWMWQLFWVFFLSCYEFRNSSKTCSSQHWTTVIYNRESMWVDSHSINLFWGNNTDDRVKERVSTLNSVKLMKKRDSEKESESLLLQYVFNTINLSLRCTMMTIIYDAIERVRVSVVLLMLLPENNEPIDHNHADFRNHSGRIVWMFKKIVQCVT